MEMVGLLLLVCLLTCVRCILLCVRKCAVIRCKDLQRNHAGPTAPINAYVKVAKLAAGRSIPDTGFQRTRVHRDSTEPFFNHRFILDAPPAQQTATLGERIQLTVWHRDGESK